MNIDFTVLKLVQRMDSDYIHCIAQFVAPDLFDWQRCFLNF